MDGVLLFDNLPYFNAIKNLIYKDLISNFQPKITKYAKELGINFFNKFCFFSFRLKYKDPENTGLGKTYTIITFCLDKEYSQATLDKFSQDFKNSVSEAVFNEPKYMKVQNYRLKQNIEIQYYDPMAKIDPNNPEVPDFFTSFSPEGLVLNKDPNYDPTKVKFSFRFDQLVDCTPKEAGMLKKVLDPKISALYKPDECCVSYLVDWQMKGVKNMFCSMFQETFKCKTDIKIFQSTVYEYCIANKIANFNLLMKKNNNQLQKAKLSFLELAGSINFLSEIIENNLEKYQSPVSKLRADIIEIKKTAKENKMILLKIFGKETNKDDGTPNCEDILNGALENNKNNKESKKDFESENRQQEKAQKTPGAQALNMINQYKFKYCKEMKDSNIEEKKDDKKKTTEDKKNCKDKKNPEEKGKSEKKETEKEKKPETIKEKLNEIKKMAISVVNQCKTKDKLTPVEAMNMTNFILKHHKTFENASKKNIHLSKKVCQQLKSDPDVALINLEKLLNEKKDKFTYDKIINPPITPKNDGQNPLKREEVESIKPDIKVLFFKAFFNKNII